MKVALTVSQMMFSSSSDSSHDDQCRPERLRRARPWWSKRSPQPSAMIRMIQRRPAWRPARQRRPAPHPRAHGSGDAAAVKAAVSDSKVDGAWLRSGGQRDARPGAIRARRGIQREHKMGDLDKAACDEK